METCKLCLNNVENLKTNSHTIPRWALSHTKENGRLIEIKEDSAKKVQSDLTGEIVCEDCERLFKANDDFSATFYREKKYLIREFSDKDIGFEEHTSLAKNELENFVLSVILRHDLYLQKYENKSLTGPVFEELRNCYLENTFSTSRFNMITFKYTAHSQLHAYPWKTRQDGFNGIDLILFGYRSTLFTDRKGYPNEYAELIQQPTLFIPIIGGMNNDFSAGLIKRAKRTEPQLRRRKK